MQSDGILYIAAGEKYIRAATRSALSVRRHCPDLPIHLFADWIEHPGFEFGRDPSPFTSVAAIEAPHRRSKLDYFSRTPFERTLYLDTDTHLNADIRGMFQLLERFDLALAQAHKRGNRPQSARWRIGLPEAFPQFNSGVMLYRRTPEVIRFLEEWRDSYYAAGIAKDQTTLRELLWLSDLRIATLPPEYNLRYMKYHLLWSRNEATTRIFHLRQFHGGWLTWVIRPLWKLPARLARRAREGGLAGLWRRKPRA